MENPSVWSLIMPINALEMNQIIVGKKNPGFGEDTAVAIFAYLSKENDLLRDFITEKALDL